MRAKEDNANNMKDKAWREGSSETNNVAKQQARESREFSYFGGKIGDNDVYTLMGANSPS
jgi:hypothetical protein